jgi:NADH dehydrogenase/NADH:ubiquinone oxidoreductase subunit G
MAKTLFAKTGATVGLMVDPIGPIKMKSRTEWILGEQGAPNFRGVSAVLGDVNAKPLDIDYAGVDVLYICDARFSDRASDPAVVANLRKAKFLIVHSWNANHPLTEIADVVIPAAIHAEKDGTYINVQGKVQRIHQAFTPKGQAETDLEALRRVGARLFPSAHEFDNADRTGSDRLDFCSRSPTR